MLSVMLVPPPPRGGGDWVMWRAYAGVKIHFKFDQIPYLQICFTPLNKNLGGERASDRCTRAAKYLYWSIFKKSRPFGVW